MMERPRSKYVSVSSLQYCQYGQEAMGLINLLSGCACVSYLYFTLSLGM